MQDPFLVGVLQGFADFRNDGQGLIGTEATGPHRLPQIDAIHILHQQVEIAGRLPEIENPHDVGVAEAGEQLRFPLEAAGKC